MLKLFPTALPWAGMCRPCRACGAVANGVAALPGKEAMMTDVSEQLAVGSEQLKRCGMASAEDLRSPRGGSPTLLKVGEHRQLPRITRELKMVEMRAFRGSVKTL